MTQCLAIQPCHVGLRSDPAVLWARHGRVGAGRRHAGPQPGQTMAWSGSRQTTAWLGPAPARGMKGAMEERRAAAAPPGSAAGPGTSAADSPTSARRRAGRPSPSLLRSTRDRLRASVQNSSSTGPARRSNSVRRGRFHAVVRSYRSYHGPISLRSSVHPRAELSVPRAERGRGGASEEGAHSLPPPPSPAAGASVSSVGKYLEF